MVAMDSCACGNPASKAHYLVTKDFRS